MFRKAEICGQRDGLPAGDDAFSGIGSVLRRLANVQPEDARVHAELLRAVHAAAPAVLMANLVNGALIVLVFWRCPAAASLDQLVRTPFPPPP